MAATTTTNLGLSKPATGDTAWGSLVNGNWDRIDGLAGTVGQFAVRATAIDPGSGKPADLRFTIAGGTWVNSDGSDLDIPATSGLRTVPPNATTYIWHDGSGDPGTGTSWPATGPFMPLAIVTSDGTKITDIVDKRGPAIFLRDAQTLYLPAERHAASATLTSFDTLVYADCGFANADMTLTLPAIAGQDGRLLTFLRVDNAAHTATIAGGGATINGASTYALTSQYQRVTLVACERTTPAQWLILAT